MSDKIAVITSVIRTIRGQKVILDSDLARIYGVPTKALNQAFKRNAKRFRRTLFFKSLKLKQKQNFVQGHKL